MAGKALRKSNGQFAGSTKGWRAGARGRVGMASGKARSLGNALKTRRGIVAGASAGVGIAAAGAGAKLIISGSRTGNMKKVAAGGALNVVAKIALTSAVTTAGVSMSKKRLAR